MYITWIIGNGFDSNLGLETSYACFRDRVYLSDSLKSRLRDDLVNRLDVDSSDKGFKRAELWSDLERLLGEATKLYKQDEDELFSSTFEEMERLLTDYVHSQELRIPSDISDECFKEFSDSICRFDSRMVYQDRRQFDLSGISQSNSHRFVCLNYTTSLDRFVDIAASSNWVLRSHRVGASEYTDSVSRPFHVHSDIDANGNIIEVVFGVDSVDQIANEQFASDPLFAQRWVKKDRNTALFGNNNEHELQRLIGGADVVCVYGCSMGESDSRIWRLVAERLLSNASFKLVLFVHGLSDRRGHDHMKYQKECAIQIDAFKQASGLKDDEVDLPGGRIFVVPSGDYFRLSDKLELGE